MFLFQGVVNVGPVVVIVYDPGTGEILADLSEPNSSLRWEEFIEALAASYRARFED